MAYDEPLAERIRAAIAPSAAFTEQKMFGGLSFMVGGNMACGIVKDELMVRTGPQRYEEALAMPNARPMELTGRPMRGMVTVGVEGIRDEADLAGWVGMGVEFAASLPARAPRGRSRV